MAIPPELLEEVARYLQPLSVRVANSNARAVVTRIDDSKKLQTLQIGVQHSEPLDDAERFQEYGFTSVPLEGAEAVVSFPNGDHGHPLVVAVDDRRHRPTGLPPGTTCVYAAGAAEVRLGTGAAAQGAIRGTDRNTAEQTFLDALATFVGAMLDAGAPSPARTTMASAIAAFKAAAAAAVSQKVKLE